MGCDVSIAVLAEACNLSANSCRRRVKRMEHIGVITRRVALLDPAILGLDLTVFVSIRTSEHSEAWLEAFSAEATRMMHGGACKELVRTPGPRCSVARPCCSPHPARSTAMASRPMAGPA